MKLLTNRVLSVFMSLVLAIGLSPTIAYADDAFNDADTGAVAESTSVIHPIRRVEYKDMQVSSEKGYKPKIKVYSDGKELTRGTDYIYRLRYWGPNHDYEKPQKVNKVTQAGYYGFVIIGKGDYKGAKKVKRYAFQVVDPIDIGNDCQLVDLPDRVPILKIGQYIKYSYYSLVVNNAQLDGRAFYQWDNCFDLKYVNQQGIEFDIPQSVGTYTVRVVGKRIFTGSFDAQKVEVVDAVNMDRVGVEGKNNDKHFHFENVFKVGVEPEYRLYTYGDNGPYELVKDKDYTVSMTHCMSDNSWEEASNFNEPGEYYLTFTGINGYVGTKSDTFWIQDVVDHTNNSVEIGQSMWPNSNFGVWEYRDDQAIYGMSLYYAFSGREEGGSSSNTGVYIYSGNDELVGMLDSDQDVGITPIVARDTDTLKVYCFARDPETALGFRILSAERLTWDERAKVFTYSDISVDGVSGQDWDHSKAYAYTGSAVKPIASVSVGGEALVEGKDYRVDYLSSSTGDIVDPVDPGYYYVRITNLLAPDEDENHEFNFFYRIYSPYSLEKADIVGRSKVNLNASGASTNPIDKVTLDDSELVEGRDYTVEYFSEDMYGDMTAAMKSAPTAAGKYVAIVRGISPYMGYQGFHFEVVNTSTSGSSDGPSSGGGSYSGGGSSSGGSQGGQNQGQGQNNQDTTGGNPGDIEQGDQDKAGDNQDDQGQSGEEAIDQEQGGQNTDSTNDDGSSSSNSGNASENGKTGADDKAGESGKDSSSESVGEKVDEVEVTDSLSVNVTISSGDTVTVTSSEAKPGSNVVVNVIVIVGQTYKVTIIAPKAFENTKASKVTIGSNVKEIGSNAFRNSSKLEEVVVGKNVSKIGKGAFSGGKALKSVTLGRSVKLVGKGTFKGCKKLKSVTVKSGNLTKKSIRNIVTGSNVKMIKLSGKAAKSSAAKYSKWLPKKVKVKR